MKDLKKYLGRLEPRDLRKAVGEIIEWQNTAILSDGIVRKIEKEYRKGINVDREDHFLRLIESAILLEAAERWVECEEYFGGPL